VISLKLTWHELFYLSEAHLHWALAYLEGEASDYGGLLAEHAKEYVRIMDIRLHSGKKNYRLKLTSLQALAFMQIWTGTELPASPTGIVILKVMAAIDKKHKETKRLIHA
jgi:hypothetical protein